MPCVRCPQESAQSPQQILFRFATFLLACVLLALHSGYSLSREIADLCQVAGLNGLAFYFALEAVADQRARNEKKKLQDSNAGFNLHDQRLAHRLSEEKRLAKILEPERLHKR